MNDDELDRMLRERGAQWRAEQAPPPAVDTASLTARTQSRWVAPVAAAAAVAVVVGGVVWATSGDGNRRGEEPAPVDGATVRADFVVPWVAADPRRPKWPAPVRTWTPDPAYAEGVETCRADQLETAVRGGGGEGGEGGAEMQLVRFMAASEQRCALPTDLQLSFLAAGAPLELEAQEAPPNEALPAWPGTRLLLEGDDTAVLGLFPSREWCRASAEGVEAVLAWPEGEVTVALGDCDPQQALAGAPVTVVPLQPEGASYEDPWPALTPLEARQVSHTAGTGDQPDTFVVELLATERDLSLDVCPDATVSERYSYDDFVEMRYGLNCAGVPYVDSDGTPYLPKGVPVRFAVEAPVEGQGPEGISWMLHGPQPTKVELELTDQSPSAESTPSGSPEEPVETRTAEERSAGEPRIVSEEEANFLLDISNQSFDQPTIATKVYVDDVLLVDREFHVEGQHTWVKFPILVEPGPHELRVEVAGGAPYETTVEVPADKPTYGLLQHWTEAPEGSSWTWDQQDHGFAYA